MFELQTVNKDSYFVDVCMVLLVKNIMSLLAILSKQKCEPFCVYVGMTEVVVGQMLIVTCGKFRLCFG